MATEGIFGMITFGRVGGGIRTFYQIQRKYTGRFAKHMVPLQKPLTQWSGNDLITVDLSMNLNAAWCGDPLPILSEFHYMHETALAAPLIIGSTPMGPGFSLFVITGLNESHEHWLPRGRLIHVTLDVSLEEYIPSIT